MRDGLKRRVGAWDCLQGAGEHVVGQETEAVSVDSSSGHLSANESRTIRHQLSKGHC